MKVRELLRLAKEKGFKIVRQKGSHIRLAHEDGRKTTIPNHKNDLKPGTLDSILKDLGAKDERR